MKGKVFMAILQEYFTERNSLIGFYELIGNGGGLDLPRKIGIDRIVISSELLNIDWDTFDAVLTSEEGHIKSLVAYDCRKAEKLLQICDINDKPHWYSKIEVKIGSNKLSLRKCNLPNSRDICIFEICIPPMKGYESFGNIHNLSCFEEQQHVLALFETVEKYGIYLNKNIAIVKNIELNVNVLFAGVNRDFQDAIELLLPCCSCLGKGFTLSDYFEISSKSLLLKSPHFHTDFQTKDLNIKKRNITSFRCESPSITLKVYDKSFETISKADGVIKYMSPVTRIEFVVTDAKEIPVYFNKKVNLLEMTQKDVEDAFHKLSSNLIRNSIKKYYDNWNAALERYFSLIQLKPGYMKHIVADLDGQVKKANQFLLLTKEDLTRYINCLPSKTHSNRARNVNRLCELFKQYAVCIRIVDTDICEEFANWLCSIVGTEPQNILYMLNNTHLEEQNNEFISNS